MPQYPSYRPHPATDATPSRPALVVFLGVLGLLGCVALVAGMLVAQSYVPDHEWMADTISDLAAGENEIIMDVALYGFAISLFATALAAAHLHLGARGWSVGIIALSILAAVVVVIGARNEYGDGDSEGVVIHIYLVYALGVFFAVAAFSMYRGLREHYPLASVALFWLGIAWTLAAPVFFMMPDGLDGLYERGLGVIACAMVALLHITFLRHARRMRPSAG